MPKPFPIEFRRDVIAAARQGDQSTAQVAELRDLGVLPQPVVEDRRSRGWSGRPGLRDCGRRWQQW
jgi:hypothetical protein